MSNLFPLFNVKVAKYKNKVKNKERKFSKKLILT